MTTASFCAPGRCGTMALYYAERGEAREGPGNDNSCHPASNPRSVVQTAASPHPSECRSDWSHRSKKDDEAAKNRPLRAVIVNDERRCPAGSATLTLCSSI